MSKITSQASSREMKRWGTPGLQNVLAAKLNRGPPVMQQYATVAGHLRSTKAGKSLSSQNKLVSSGGWN